MVTMTCEKNPSARRPTSFVDRNLSSIDIPNEQLFSRVSSED